MDLKWTSKALSDLARLHKFLAPVNKSAATHTIKALTTAPNRLIEQPRIGERLDEFSPRDVRRILIDRYEMRYELDATTVYVPRLWHTREDR